MLVVRVGSVGRSVLIVITSVMAKTSLICFHDVNNFFFGDGTMRKTNGTQMNNERITLLQLFAHEWKYKDDEGAKRKKSGLKLICLFVK